MALSLYIIVHTNSDAMVDSTFLKWLEYVLMFSTANFVTVIRKIDMFDNSSFVLITI